MKNNFYYISVITFLLFASLAADAARLSVLFSGSSSGVTFSGYAGPFNGNLGGIKGSNDKCIAAFTGSHVCTYDEIVKLGSNYTYANSIWFVVGGINAADGGGFINATGSATANQGYGTCYGWVNSVATNYGNTLSTTGLVSSVQCSTTQYLACCK